MEATSCGVANRLMSEMGVTFMKEFLLDLVDRPSFRLRKGRDEITYSLRSIVPSFSQSFSESRIILNSSPARLAGRSS